MASIWDDELDFFDTFHTNDNEAGEEDDNNDRDDDDEEDLVDGLEGSHHCLLLLDCGSPGMFDPYLPDPQYPADQISPADYILQATEAMVKTQVRTVVTLRTGQRDAFGMVLYHTRYRTPLPEDRTTSTNPSSTPTKKKNSKRGHHSDPNLPIAEEEEQEDDDDDDDDGDLMGGDYASTVHEFIPLQPPGVSTVLRIRAAQEHEFYGRKLDLQQEYAPDHDHEENGNDTNGIGREGTAMNPLQLALYQALQVFRTSKVVRKSKPGVPEDTKQLWIFTTEDDPCHGQDAIRNVLQTSISDARESGIDIVIWPVPRKDGRDFNYSLFYDSIQAETPLRNSNNQMDGLHQMLEDMTWRWKKVRRAFTIPLLLPDWEHHPERPGLAMDVYRVIQIGRLPAKIPIHQQTGRMLSRIRTVSVKGGQVLAEYGAGAVPSKRLQQDRLRHYVEFGGQRIYMTPEDKLAIKKSSNANTQFASLIILGFKDHNSIPISDTMDQTFFAYPSDERTEGSRRAFAHLHASMLRKRVLAVGELLTRVSATSRLVAMWPLREEDEFRQVDDDRENPIQPTGHTRPPGMMIVVLPFEDEVRSIGPDEASRRWEEQNEYITTTDAVQKAMNLINKQTLQDVVIGENFENAHLTDFWNYVEHVALNEPLPGTAEYEMLPNDEDVLAHIGPEAEAFSAILPIDVKVEKKRKIPVPDTTGIDWEDIVSSGVLKDLKVDQLKAKLKSYGEKLTGRKDELIARLLPLLKSEYGGVPIKQEGSPDETHACRDASTRTLGRRAVKTEEDE